MMQPTYVVMSWGTVIPQWVTVLKILSSIVIIFFLVRSVFKLIGHANSSDSKTSRDRYYWLLYPWRDGPTRAVTLWGLTLLAIVLLFFFIPIYSEMNKTTTFPSRTNSHTTHLHKK